VVAVQRGVGLVFECIPRGPSGHCLPNMPPESELNPYDAIEERIWTAMGTGTLGRQASWDTDVTVAGENYVGFHFPSARNHTQVDPPVWILSELVP
jgi:hypothetical protein